MAREIIKAFFGIQSSSAFRVRSTRIPIFGTSQSDAGIPKHVEVPQPLVGCTTKPVTSLTRQFGQLFSYLAHILYPGKLCVALSK